MDSELITDCPYCFYFLILHLSKKTTKNVHTKTVKHTHTSYK